MERGLLFTMTGACGIPGGIATLNRNILCALIDLAEQARIELTVFSYLESDAHRPVFLPDKVQYKPLQEHKLSLSANLLRRVNRKPIFLFDHVQLSLPLLPLAATGLATTVIFAHGSESWRRIKLASRWSFRFAALCLANSGYTLRKMRERIRGINGVACPLGLSPEFPLNGEIPGSLGTIRC